MRAFGSGDGGFQQSPLPAQCPFESMPSAPWLHVQSEGQSESFSHSVRHTPFTQSRPDAQFPDGPSFGQSLSQGSPRSASPPHASAVKATSNHEKRMEVA
jgi:hypothetical protein